MSRSNGKWLGCSIAALSLILLAGCEDPLDGEPEPPPYRGEGEKELKPKKTVDTELHYRPELKKQIDQLPETKLENLGKLCKLLLDQRKKANESPGAVRPGRVGHGAYKDQYVPSSAQLMESVIGKRIRRLVLTQPGEKVLAELKKNKIKGNTIAYRAVQIDHVDIEGQGRYYYAQKPIETKVLLPNR